MQRQARADTAPEQLLRRELYALGLRYRLHARPVPSLRRRVDIVFRKGKVAVEVRGCFWHACPQHGVVPKSNVAWWREKLRRNRERDVVTASALRQAGWLLIVVWEHQDPAAAASGILSAVLRRRASQRRA